MIILTKKIFTLLNDVVMVKVLDYDLESKRVRTPVVLFTFNFALIVLGKVRSP